MADALTFYYANFGDWRKLFTSIDDIAKVTADDVQRVARQYLIPDTRTVAYTTVPSKSQRGERSRSMRRLLFALLLAGVLSAQTEVRRAMVLPSYKDLKFPPLPPHPGSQTNGDYALQWHEGSPAGGSRTAAGQRHGADSHRESFRSRR